MLFCKRELHHLRQAVPRGDARRQSQARKGQAAQVKRCELRYSVVSKLVVHPRYGVRFPPCRAGACGIHLAEEGYDVTAVELVKYNLGILKQKGSTVKAYQGTALNLKRFQDNTFDMTLVFGPMYHLYSFEDKVKALTEAKRVTKQGGVILVAYCMNEYSIVLHGFKDNYIKESIKEGKVNADFRVTPKPEDLYDYVRLEDINSYNEAVGLERLQIVAADGPANYMRQTLNAMDEETYDLFIQYHLSTCERPELLGASAHTLDILRKK